MMPLQNTCTKVIITPQSLSAAGTATEYVDTLGYDEAAIDFIMDSQAATTSNPAVLKLGEGDTSTAATDITAFVGDATDGYTIPATQTTPGVTRLNVDLRARKRYLALTVTVGDVACLVCAVGTFGKAADSTTARAGMAGVADG
ncbi:MAG: hypothetical protein NUW01_03065 [Gemmatimonadaceae bacterium]|nr:hypothetical protein [Gemmatimonadaceae bacterium]